MFERLKRIWKPRRRRGVEKKVYVGECYEVVTSKRTIELRKITGERVQWRGTWIGSKNGLRDDQVLEITYCAYPKCKDYNVLLTYGQVIGWGGHRIIGYLETTGVWFPIRREIDEKCMFAIVNWFRKEVGK